MASAEVYRRYRAAGFSAIPLGDPGHLGKVPRVRWQEYQTRRPTDEEIGQWERDWPKANVGLLMAGSGCFALDIDGGYADAIKALCERGIFIDSTAPEQRTGKGHHIILSADRPIRDAVGWMRGDGWQIDVRGIGYICVAPSIHYNAGTREFRHYEWVVELDGPPPMAPAELVEALEQRTPVPSTGGLFAPVDHPSWVTELLEQGSVQGQRNNDLTRLAGYFFVALPPDIARAVLSDWGSKQGLPDREIQSTLASVERRARNQRTLAAASPAELAARVEQRKDGRTVGALLQGLLRSAQDETDFLVTPYPRLNTLLSGGLTPTEYTLLGARPSVGKTAMALEFADVAAASGRRVLLVSLEMAADAIAGRMAVRKSGIPAGRLRAGGLQGQELAELAKAVAELQELPIVIETGLTTAAEVYAHVEQAAKDGLPYGLVIVDYLQEMAATTRKNDRRLEVTESSQVLKQIAKQLAVPTIAISSIKRGGTGAPTMSDLKESGDLEFQGDVILLLHRELKSNRLHVNVEKARNAKPGDFYLFFDGTTQRFQEDTNEYEEPF